MARKTVSPRSPKKLTTKDKPAAKAQKTGSPLVGLLLWVVFIIVVIVLYLVNRSTILEIIERTDFFNKLRGSSSTVSLATDDLTESDLSSDLPELIQPPDIVSPPASLEPLNDPASRAADSQSDGQVLPTESALPQSPANSRPISDGLAATAVNPKLSPESELRKTTIWFSRVDSDGHIGQEKVLRSLALSETPLKDAINALLAGPLPAETTKGLSSLIPPATSLLSAMVRGTTAYLSFSEDFQFNAFGIEGYAGQLRQIILTSTEFPTVNDVQVLIEGRRVDFLGSEGIWIGSPLNRESL